MSSPITSCELAAMQNALEDTLNASGTIYRLSRSSDSAGGHSGSFVAIGTADFDVIRGNAFERRIGDQIVSVQEFKGWVPVGTDIDGRDRVRCNGAIYEVTSHDAGAPNNAVITLRMMMVGQ